MIIYPGTIFKDTCVALQALSQYSEKTAGASLDLRVSISSEKDASWKRNYHIDPDNALILRQEEVSLSSITQAELKCSLVLCLSSRFLKVHGIVWSWKCNSFLKPPQYVTCTPAKATLGFQ